MAKGSKRFVVDTGVPLTANGEAGDGFEACALKCEGH